jgi:PAS domain S-box-containing protein
MIRSGLYEVVGAHWPRGEGEMARCIRAHDWARTALGPIGGWPASLRVTVESMLASPVPLHVYWGPEHIELYNDAARALAGARHDSLGLPAEDGQPGLWRELYRPLFAEILRGNGAALVRDRQRTLERDGQFVRLWLDYSLSPIALEDGSVGGILVMAIDITERKQTQATLAAVATRDAFRVRLADALRVPGHAREIQTLACRLLGEHLVAQRVLYLDIEGEEFVLRPGYVDGVQPLRERGALCAELGAQHRRGEVVVVADIASDPGKTAAEREAYRAWQIAAYVMVMLVKNDACVAAFVVHSSRPRAWSEAEVELIQDVAERLWSALERARAEEALRESEARLRMLIEAAFQSVWETDAAGAVVDDSPSWRAYTGQTIPEWRGSGWLDAAHPDDRESAESFWRAAIARGESDSAVFRLRTPEGRWRWTQVHVVPLRSRDGTIAKWIGMNLDVSARKQAEDALRLAEAQQSFLLELSDEIRELQEPREIVRAATKRLMRHLGLYPGASALALRAQDKQAWLDALLASAHPARRWTEGERWLQREVAERTWSAVERARAQDVLRASEQRLKDLLSAVTAAHAEAERANRAKDEFLATLSHELRTPLAAILLWASALRSGAAPATELARAAHAIVESAESQSRLIEDLLDLSRLTSGKLRLAPAPVLIEEVARSALDVVRPSARAKLISLEGDIPDDLGRCLLDAARFKQILWNLLSNATKFTPERGRVTLRLRRRAVALEAEVSDNGIGIDPTFMPHVFERFRQADMGETRRHAGLGIGLALTRHLVELQGGTIEAVSAGHGQGALFRVCLPWLPAPEDAPATAIAKASAPDVASLVGVTVLLVEDDAHTRDAMARTLVHAGARVVAVGSSAEALRVVEHAEGAPRRAPAPNVIVCDLGLPDMSGLALLERVVRRCRERGKRCLPALAVSAHAREVDRQRAMDAGFDLYLTKPVAPERLVEAVEDLRDVAAAAPAESA